MTLSFGATCEYRYASEDCIGRGAFGNVYQATITKRGSFRGDEIVAIKVVHVPGDSQSVQPQNWEKFLQRSQKLLDLQHKNLVRYHKVSVTSTLHGKVIDFVMDYCSGRDLALLLKDLREKNSTLMYADVLRYTLEITDGLQFLHENHIIHGDLKPANILLKCHTSGQHTLLIGDLDDCVQMHNPVTTTRDISHYRGTVRYMSPEMMQKYVSAGDDVVGRKTDVWSLGCIVAEMVNCSAGNFDNRLHNWRSGEIFQVENNTPNHLIARKILDGFAPYIQNLERRDIASCVETCFSKPVEQRITASELLQKMQKFGPNGSRASLVDKATTLQSGEESKIIQTTTRSSKTLAYIANELLESERKFVDDLRFVVSHCMKHFEENNRVPPNLAGKRPLIFGNWETLHRFHERIFLVDMESRELTPRAIGELFCEYEQDFEVHAEFCRIQINSTQQQINVDADIFFRTKSVPLPVGETGLNSYLEKPFKRLVAYKRILGRLIQELPIGSTDHADFRILQAASDKVDFFLHHGNDLAYQDLIRHHSISLDQQGRLLRQDEMLVRKGSNPLLRGLLNQRQRIFLFEKVIVLTKWMQNSKKSDGWLKIKRELWTDGIGLTENPNGSKTAFKIWFDRPTNPVNAFELEAENEATKQLWVKDITRILATVKTSRFEQLNKRFEALKRFAQLWSIGDTYAVIEINQNSRIPATDLPHRIKKLYADLQIGLSREYKSLASILIQSAATDTTFVPSMKEALKLENRPKNRYVNVLPYDHSRVKLKTQWNVVPVGTLDKETETQPLTNGKVEAEQEDNDSNCGGCFSSGGLVKNAVVVDYINASFVDGIHAPDAYILTQAPMTNTLGDFWCMVWDYNVRVVIMLTNLEENGWKKSELYWPTATEQPATYGPFTVGLVNEMVTAFYTVRTLSLTYEKPGEEGEMGETRQVVQYMYNDWPDHGRPDITVPLLRFIIKSSRAFEDDNFGPPIVHCSAGVGRSGCYIALHSLMLELDRTGHVDIFTYLLNARKQRMGLCQNESQYALIYDALLEYMQSGHTEVYAATFDEYMDTLIRSDMAGLKLQHSLVVGARSVCSSGGFNFANSFEYATQGYNKGKNRSEQFVPTDVHANRVGITPRPGELGSDYINASFLPGYWRSKEWVITQRPLEGTVAAFWQMIWEYKITTVLHVLDTDTPDLAFIPPPSTPLRTTDFTVTQLPADPAAPSLLPDTPPSQPWEHRTLQCRLAVIMPDNAPPIPTEDLVCQVVPVQLPPGENSGWWDLLERVEGIMGKGMTVVMDETGGPEAGLLAGAVMIRQMVVGEGSVDVYGVARLYNHIRPEKGKRKPKNGQDQNRRRVLKVSLTTCLPTGAYMKPPAPSAGQPRIPSPAGMLQTTPPTKLPLSLSKRLSAILEEENAVAS